VSVSAPPRPPRPNDPVDRAELEALVEALIEEARQRARSRRRRHAAVAALMALLGVLVFTAFERTTSSESLSPALAARSSFATGTAGSMIAFLRSPRYGDGSEPSAIYVVNADGTEERRLAGNSFGVDWSPDGRRIAFHSTVDGSWGIYVMDVDGGGLRRLTSGTVPHWSPNGQTIAFAREADGGAELYLIGADGSGLRRLTRAGASERGFRWSPDGRRIAFSGSTRDGNWDVYVMNTDGGGLRRLTRSPGFEHYPAWSPDGRRIAFTRTSHKWKGAAAIHVMNADGSGLRKLADGASYTWSPDGGEIVFVGNRDDPSRKTYGTAIFVINTDGSGPRVLMRNVDEDLAPSWSPDGRQIAFSGRGGIYLMKADGSNTERLTRNRDWFDWAPVWSPAPK
jgi:Tol biopolymer transport system component